MPIAAAGLDVRRSVDADLFVLELPHASATARSRWVAFIGGLSAATAMVIVESVALAIMISNEIVVPAVLRAAAGPGCGRHGAVIPTPRRTAIVLLLLLGYAYYRMAGAAALASIGLLAFAAIAQLAPSFFGGLLWRRATARGAVGGMLAGFAVWAYTLLLPSFAHTGYLPASFLEEGLFGISLLRPQALFAFAFEPLTHGCSGAPSQHLVLYRFS